MRCPYETLQVERGATKEKIRAQFKLLAKSRHPDARGGDADAFKDLNEAYAVLGDDGKRRQHDLFGGFEAAAGGAASAAFGGFHPAAAGLHEIFANMFAAPSERRAGAAARDTNVSVRADISDLFYGRSKMVDVEVDEKCATCEGSGARSKAHVVDCLVCGGKGSLNQNIGPVSLAFSCKGCMGRGSVIMRGMECRACGGDKTKRVVRSFDVKVPRFVSGEVAGGRAHKVVVRGKGDYDVASCARRDVCVSIDFDIRQPYEVLGNDVDVLFSCDLKLEELLGGFSKNVRVYDETVTLRSSHYFNPEKLYAIPGLGLRDLRRGKTGVMYLKFNVVFGDNARLARYRDVFAKVVGAQQVGPEGEAEGAQGRREYTIQDLLASASSSA
jgi:molecular chaperone DnaJ